MAKEYRLGFVRRMVNRIVARRLRSGKEMGDTVLLTTLGRKSGLERTTPVTLARRDGLRYLVAPYGAVGWVHNLRDSGVAELLIGSEVEEISVTEVDAATAAPVLKQYVNDVSVVRSFFDADKDDSVDKFEAEASRHPVFRINV
ncbi:MAG: nitroreductase family deazaflavin-dependent oxidoreductase [Acidimicrobiia bacterium]|nr:nitroreductase family deazaflavin-dependent oxidoreductase [Acidimicrobiia bacterium]